MRFRKQLISLAVAGTIAAAPLTGNATGIPVIDIAALTQLIQEIMYWQQQIAAMNSQLNELQNTYNSLNGSRGLGGLMTLTNAQRNYLPPDYQEIQNVLNNVSSNYSGLSSKVSAVMAANAVLNSTQLSNLSPQQRTIVEEGRRAAAMISTLTQSGYQNTSGRFSQLQGLISQINGTTDPKAIAELQARISGEQTMLANEQTKMQTLYYMAQAEQITQHQKLNENRIAEHGRFADRPASVFP